jgi:hypothetical protein
VRFLEGRGRKKRVAGEKEDEPKSSKEVLTYQNGTRNARLRGTVVNLE